MSKLNVLAETSASYKDFYVFSTFIELENGFLVLVSDQENYGIGTISIAIPPSTISNKSTNSPFNVFGLKNNLLANIVSKNASKRLKKPILSTILIKEKMLKPQIITKVVMEAVSKGIKQIEKVM